ncbi:hypothetical protein [Haladaptatus sp. CMAA 1911]|uniref:hypothetical protein n=1 Tax=unclassified Haladaptatus TaxID=2622732 RepID=UPI0037540414
MSNTFGWFSGVLDQYESGRAEIRRVEAIRPDDSESNRELRASVDIAVPMCAPLTDESDGDSSSSGVTIREDGGLQVDLPPSVLPTMNRIDDDRILVEKRENARIENGTILVTTLITLSSDDASERTRAEENDATHRLDESVEDTAMSSDHGTGESDDRSSVVGDESEHGPSISTARNDDLPPYEDVEYLQRIYDTCETFVEMAAVIEMDVSAETVRRYMTEADVHEPTSYNTVSSSDAETVESSERSEATSTSEENDVRNSENDSEPTPADRKPKRRPDGTDSDSDDPVDGIKNQQLIADGIGLPNDVTIDQLADAVESSITVHEVKQELNIERDDARRLLERLNLLDLVLTRVWRENGRRVSRDKIVDRIRLSVTKDS